MIHYPLGGGGGNCLLFSHGINCTHNTLVETSFKRVCLMTGVMNPELFVSDPDPGEMKDRINNQNFFFTLIVLKYSSWLILLFD